MPDESDESPLFCDRCSRELQPGRGEFYLVTIDAVADPSPPVFAEEDLAIDFDQEFQRLFEETRDLTAQEAMDQVHRRLVLYLCVSCYTRWIENPTGS